MLVIAEYSNDIDGLCRIISDKSPKRYNKLQSFGGCDKITGIVVADYKQKIMREDSRYTIIHMSNALCQIIFSFIHAESKLHSEDADRQVTYSFMNRDIEEAEKKLK